MENNWGIPDVCSADDTSKREALETNDGSRHTESDQDLFHTVSPCARYT